MNAAHARIAILTLLHRQGFATRYEILALRDMTAELYEPIRAQFLLRNLAIEGPEGGLTYVGRIPFADALGLLDRLHAHDVADAPWGEYRAGVERLSAESRVFLPLWLTEAERWDDLETLLTDLAYLEARNAAGELVDLLDDFARGVAALPGDRPQQPILKLLLEALRRDADFIARHAQDYPQGMFQCLWNSGWWYDCAEAAGHYDPPSGGWPIAGPPWNQMGVKLCTLLERWRAERERAAPGFSWLRALRPPAARLGDAQLAVLRGHTEDIRGVRLSPDGRRIATFSYDQTLRVWDSRSGAERAVLSGHTAVVSCMSYSPDGVRIVSGSNDCTVRFWDVETGAELAVLRTHTEPVSHAVYSPDGFRIASVDRSRDVKVHVWEARTVAAVTVLAGHMELVKTLAWSPDSRRIATGAVDRTVRIWDLQTSNVTVLRGHHASVKGLSFSPDGRRIASGSRDGTVRVWDVEKGTELAVLEGYQGAISSVRYSPDGRRIATASYRPSVWVWDAETFKSIKLVQGTGDMNAALAESEGIAFGVTAEKTETVFSLAGSGRNVALFPRRFPYLVAGSSGSDWAGADANALYLLTLEGDRQFGRAAGSDDIEEASGRRRPSTVDIVKSVDTRRGGVFRDLSRDLFRTAADPFRPRAPGRDAVCENGTTFSDGSRLGSAGKLRPWLFRCAVAAVAAGLIMGLALGVARHVRSATLLAVRQQLKEAAKADDAPPWLKGVDWDTASLADVRIKIEPSAMQVLIITHRIWKFWYVWGAIVFCICLGLTGFLRKRT